MFQLHSTEFIERAIHDGFSSTMSNNIIGINGSRKNRALGLNNSGALTWQQNVKSLLPISSLGQVVNMGTDVFTSVGSFNYSGINSEGTPDQAFLICQSSYTGVSTAEFRIWDYTNTKEVIQATAIPTLTSKTTFLFSIEKSKLPSTDAIMEFQIKVPTGNPTGSLTIYGLGIVYGEE